MAKIWGRLVQTREHGSCSCKRTKKREIREEVEGDCEEVGGLDLLDNQIRRIEDRNWLKHVLTFVRSLKDTEARRCERRRRERSTSPAEIAAWPFRFLRKKICAAMQLHPPHLQKTCGSGCQSLGQNGHASPFRYSTQKSQSKN